ncbi:class I SAM-dependent methyltransferase [Ignavibacterium sp.]|uniref:class I SAM-dependent methyltransferase n=1 Tax=Ignavibacterium sp. TaxID=2651167 RepID=UPI00307E75AA
MTSTNQNSEKVNLAFTKQSLIYDEYEKSNNILEWMRQQVYNAALNFLKPGDKILELNSGTGTDALYFAKLGFEVLCTDLSDGMVEKISEKIKKENPGNRIRILQCSYTELDKLSDEKFDFIFSNFGGLNCINDLTEVTRHFPNLLNENGKVCLVIMPTVCPWEIIQIIKFNFKFAFRRFNKFGADANVEGVSFKTYYFSYKKIKSALGSNFKIIYKQGLAVFTPIPQMENFIKKHPHFVKLLQKLDEMFSKHFPFNLVGDHLIIIAEYNSTIKNK